MGWQHDTHWNHEGWAQAVEQLADDRWVDLARPANHPAVPVEYLQVCCTCGWRSARLIAPVRTTWSYGSMDLPKHPTDPDFYEMAAYHCWRTEHADLLPPSDAHPARRTSAQTLNTWAREHGMKPRPDRGHLTLIGGTR